MSTKFDRGCDDIRSPQSALGPNRARSTFVAARGRRNPPPSSSGCGAPPKVDWPKTLGLLGAFVMCLAAWADIGLALAGVLLAALCVCGLLIALGGGVVLLERLFPNADVLGGDEATQERLACHVLYPAAETVEAAPVDRPIAKCSKCREPVFLAGLCAYHFEIHTDLSYEHSWEQSHDF